MKTRLEYIIEKHAKENDYSLNRNSRVLKAILQGLMNNRQKYGDYYCPCRIEKIKENICPCASHKEEIEKHGECHCQLFYKKNDIH